MGSICCYGCNAFIPEDRFLNILVTGASGQIGHFLLPLIVRQGHRCLCLSRHIHGDTQGVRWISGDLETGLEPIWDECGADAWVHLAFLPLAIPHLEAAAKAGVKRFVGFSSTSVFTRKGSGSSKEHQVIQQLTEVETRVKSICQIHNVAWTLFRPTMIYGCGMDQNIAFIRRVIDRFGVFPVAGKGKGLRQPVHAEDLAFACVAALHNKRTMNRAYNLGGGETLTYRDMTERILGSLNRKSRIISINPAVYKCAVAIMRQISPRYAFIQASMVDRMNMDMVFDHCDATNDFDYDPRPFQP